MSPKLLGLLLCVSLWCGVCVCQENASPRIPLSLLECYRDPLLSQRERRLPSSMGMLVDLIRRVEQHPEMVNRDIREVTIQLIHRFKLDGIQKTAMPASSGVVPYSPTAFQFYKHRIALTELLQGNAVNFPNETLSSIEKCSLHHMMSSTIELEVRNDEGKVCNKLSQYRTERMPRDLKASPDVEILDSNLIKNLNQRGAMQMDPDTQEGMNPDAETVEGMYNSDGPRNMEKAVSQCPVEDGIVHSRWGAVAVGPLLMGIAAGLQVTQAPIRQLNSNITAYSNLRVDNRHALTLAGDLAEVTLYQGPMNKLQVGGAGGWNSTQEARWYFLSRADNNHMTDAEIRGGLDGLILAFNMQRFKEKAPEMRLSQLLEMYYSQRGVFSRDIRACNRQAQFTEYAPTEVFMNQVLGMSLLLDEITVTPGTILVDGFKDYATRSVNSLKDYIPNSLRDLSCQVTNNNEPHGDVDIRSNVTIVLDKGFLFKDIEGTVIDLFHKLNTSPVGSSVTIISASEGKILCNTTNSLANITECFNQDVYNSMPERVDLYKVLESLRDINRWMLANETSKRWSGGMSSVALFVMSQVAIDEGSYSADMMKTIYEELPDLRFIFFTTGGKDRFNNLVREPSKDIYTFLLSPNTESQVNAVINRISQIPKRIINSRCGPDYTSGDLSGETYIGYVAPQKVNYYSLSANYFFKRNEDTHLRVTGSTASSLTLCYSRSNPLPRSNVTVGGEGVTCVPLMGTAQEITLRNTCKDVTFIHQCSPLYFSIEAGPVNDFSSAQICTERACPQSDNIKYTVNTNNLGCFSGAAHVILSASLLVACLLLLVTSHHTH